MSALAGVSENGLWLTSIDLTKNGKGITLTGRALDQGSVMRYAEKLAARLSDDGIVFRGLDVSPQNSAPDRPGGGDVSSVINFRLY